MTAMRVITGKAKGRRLYTVPGERTRPITDRAKFALFSIIDVYLPRASFLDLFAGTGQVGIEALSRGANEAVFVEMAESALRTIRANLAHTELEKNARVVRGNVFKYLETQPNPFDFIFVAPPQYRGLWVRTLEALDENSGWLASDGWIIVQIDPEEYREVELENFVLFDQRSYGGVMLCFYARPVEEQ